MQRAKRPTFSKPLLLPPLALLFRDAFASSTLLFVLRFGLVSVFLRCRRARPPSPPASPFSTLQCSRRLGRTQVEGSGGAAGYPTRISPLGTSVFQEFFSNFTEVLNFLKMSNKRSNYESSAITEDQKRVFFVFGYF